MSTPHVPNTGIGAADYYADRLAINDGAKQCRNAHASGAVTCDRPMGHQDRHGAWSPLMTAYWRW